MSAMLIQRLSIQNKETCMHLSLPQYQSVFVPKGAMVAETCKGATYAVHLTCQKDVGPFHRAFSLEKMETHDP